MDALTKLVVMALAVYGLANSIAVLKAGLPLRTFFETRELRAQNGWLKWFWAFWRSLVKCPPCLSFWFGMAASYWVLSITRGLIEPWWFYVPADGFILCGTSWLLHLWAERMGHGLDV